MTTQSPANGFRVTLITRLSRPDENRVSLEKNIHFLGFAVGVAPSIPWVEVASNLTSSALQGVGLAKEHSFFGVCRSGRSLDSMGRARFQFELVRPPRGRTRKGWRSGDVLEHPRVSGIRLRAFLLPGAPRELAFPALLAARSSKCHTRYVHRSYQSNNLTILQSTNLPL